jgi:hypothetical protein
MDVNHKRTTRSGYPLFRAMIEWARDDRDAAIRDWTRRPVSIRKRGVEGQGCARRGSSHRHPADHGRIDHDLPAPEAHRPASGRSADRAGGPGGGIQSLLLASALFGLAVTSTPRRSGSPS